jgi:hypothetical protein
VRYYTAHIRADAEPVLVREGFSWGALLFGPLWLAWHRSWIPAALSLAAGILIHALLSEPASGLASFGLAVFLGLTGHDLVRWSFEHRGYLLTHVLVARNETDAWARLLSNRPDLANRFMPAGSLR